MLLELFGPYVAPLVLHVVGDYTTQSDWVAQNKTKSWWPAFVPAPVYTAPFALITLSGHALYFIWATHYLIDRWRLARYICWVKNFLAPRSAWPPEWKECQPTGYSPSVPTYLSLWLMIVTDNTMHVICNAIALRFL